MDPVLIEVAKYGLAAFLAALVIYGQYRAIVYLFQKYDEAQNRRIEQGEKVLVTMSANTLAIQMNTAAIESLGDIIKSRNN